MKRKNTILLSVCAIVLLLAGLITGIFARYIKNSGKVTNTFTPAPSVTPTVVEEFEPDKTEKKNVKFQIGDTGYPVYVRAAIVITWKDADGTVYFSKPVEAVKSPDGDPSSEEGDSYEGDYLLDLNLSATGWVKGTDGYYYYQTPVPSGGETGYLINSCKQVNLNQPDGYTLSVEIIVQTVQAVGYTDGENDEPVIPAYQDAWGLS